MREPIKQKIYQFLEQTGFTEHIRKHESWTNEELASAMARPLFKQVLPNED